MSRRHPTKGQRFDGQVAVVTGASSGIGRSIALVLAARGATVVGLARRKDLLDELQPELAGHSPASVTAVCDVGEPDAFRDALAAAECRHGRIDHLVNNAGIDLMLPVTGLGAGAPPPDAATVREVFDVNFFSVVTGTLAVLPGMLARGSGVIVNVSSDSARAPEARQGGYAASKAAISAFSESIAHEVAPAGVRVHVLYPGWVPTAMGLSGNEDGGSLPPKAVRRTAEGVAGLTADRMGGTRIDINAARLPLLAPIARTIAPRTYQASMRRMQTTGQGNRDGRPSEK
jgi:NAD(P)-dependent dehydrogenase (short-subunit alcohol dehydrogenase family)